MTRQCSQRADSQANPARRRVLAYAGMLSVSGLAACSPTTPSFQSVDLTGAAYARDFRLKDHFGNQRSLADFQGKVSVVFFGYTQCPDVCPTSMTKMAEVKRLLGKDAARLQVLFITVDPERDTQELLQTYMQNFDPDFLALRPDPDALPTLAKEFKVYYKKVDGRTATSYTMDHTAGKYLFDIHGQIRLFAGYAMEASAIAADIQALLKSD